MWGIVSKRVQLQWIVTGAPGARLDKGLRASDEARGTFLLQHHRQPYACCNWRRQWRLGLHRAGGCAAVHSACKADDFLSLHNKARRGGGSHWAGSLVLEGWSVL
jgi:hypothetical protein